MKARKTIIIILSIAVILSFSACKNRDSEEPVLYDETTKNNEMQTSDGGNTQPQTTLPKEPSATDINKAVLEQIRTGSTVEIGEIDESAGTLTGRKALPLRDFSSFSAENTKGLSTTAVGYSYGVSKDAKPHSNSVNAQATLDKYGGLAVDLKSEEKVLYLTFDCGYEHNRLTLATLDILKEKQVPATFFVTLTYLQDTVNGGQEASIRMVNEGHIVANHSTTHPNFSKIGRTKMVEEIQMCDNYLRENYGYSAPFFRFPEGVYTEDSLELVQSIGYVSVFWSVAYADWDTTSSKGKDYALKTVTERLHPGAVILLHACSQDNVDALGDIIDWAREQGYTFVPLTYYN